MGQEYYKKKEKCIYNTIIKSFTSYGCEVWQIKEKKRRKKLLALEMDFWHRSARTSRREKVRNEIIRGKMDIKNNS
jgi:hypothetical protein